MALRTDAALADQIDFRDELHATCERTIREPCYCAMKSKLRAYEFWMTKQSRNSLAPVFTADTLAKLAVFFQNCASRFFATDYDRARYSIASRPCYPLFTFETSRR